MLINQSKKVVIISQSVSIVFISQTHYTTFSSMKIVTVELRAATIPGLPGLVADHHWLLVSRETETGRVEACDRWEVWQRANRNASCWGHLHKNLLQPYQGVGNGPSRLIQKWINNDALLLAEKIESSPEYYPFLDSYKYWPGPNSNTYAQWVVKEKTKLG